MTGSSWLQLAHDLADEADALTLPAFRSGMDVTTKDDGTVVTTTDVAVERRLREIIGERLPEHAFLGEEDGLTGDDRAPRWIIDPIDGTRNFVTGNPIWATLIAVQVDGQETAAVVSAPALGSRWDGVVTPDVRRARRDGKQVEVSQRALSDAEVSFGGLAWFQRAGQFALVDELSRRTRRQRGYGDFWHHCLVAEGVIEIAVEAAVSPWDLAAVKCIVEAAGGRFTDLRGNPTIDGGSALSTNGLVHDEVLGLLGAGADANGAAG